MYTYIYVYGAYISLYSCSVEPTFRCDILFLVYLLVAQRISR